MPFSIKVQGVSYGALKNPAEADRELEQKGWKFIKNRMSWRNTDDSKVAMIVQTPQDSSSLKPLSDLPSAN